MQQTLITSPRPADVFVCYGSSDVDGRAQTVGETVAWRLHYAGYDVFYSGWHKVLTDDLKGFLSAQMDMVSWAVIAVEGPLGPIQAFEIAYLKRKAVDCAVVYTARRWQPVAELRGLPAYHVGDFALPVNQRHVTLDVGAHR